VRGGCWRRVDNGKINDRKGLGIGTNEWLVIEERGITRSFRNEPVIEECGKEMVSLHIHRWGCWNRNSEERERFWTKKGACVYRNWRAPTKQRELFGNVTLFSSRKTNRTLRRLKVLLLTTNRWWMRGRTAYAIHSCMLFCPSSLVSFIHSMMVWQNSPFHTQEPLYISTPYDSPDRSVYIDPILLAFSERTRNLL